MPKFDMEEFRRLFPTEEQLKQVGGLGDTEDRIDEIELSKSIQEASEKQELAPLKNVGNSPDDPIPGDVGLMQRIQLEFGNSEGRIKDLKKRFEDVKYVPEAGGLVVLNNQGKWQTVEPDQVAAGDSAWDVSEHISDLVEFGAGAALPTLGFVSGTGAGAPGQVAGAVVGKMANQVLGRYFGTYDASPGEMASELAWEAALNAAAIGVFNKLPQGVSQAQAFGARVFEKVFERPSAKFVVSGLKGLKDGTTTFTRQLWEKWLTSFGGTTNAAARHVFDRPEEVGKLISERGGIFNMTKRFDDTIKSFTRDMVGKAQRLFANAQKGLSREYGKRQAQLLADPDIARYSLNVGDAGKQALDALTKVGLLVRKQIPSKILGPQGGPAAFGLGSYQVADDKVLAELLGGEQFPFWSRKAKQKLKQILPEIRSLSRAGTLTGRKGAERALRLRRNVNELLEDVYKANKDLYHEGLNSLQGFSNTIKQSFTSRAPQSIGAKYNSMQDYYAGMVEFAQEATKLARLGKAGSAEKGIENFLLNTFKERSLEKTANETMLRASGKMQGGLGEKLLNEILDLHAAQQLFKKLPHMTLSKPGFKTSFADLAVGAVKTIGTPLFSPRLNARVIENVVNGKILAPSLAELVGDDRTTRTLPYLKQFRDLIQTMNVEDKKALLADPLRLQNLMQQVIQAPDREDELNQELLNPVFEGNR